MVNFVIEINVVRYKKKVNVSPIFSIYTTCTSICFCVFCSYGVKMLVLFQRNRPQKEKRMAKNIIMYISMYTVDTIHMIHLSQPTVILFRL